MSIISAFTAFFFGRKGKIAPAEKFFFGIGNPGKRYRNTRHNAGFAALDRFSQSVDIVSDYRTDTWEATFCKVEHVSFALIKPTTYVNSCGKALADCIGLTGCPLSSCLVVVDDYHLPIGTLRMRRKGSDGGHNGLKSIIDHVGEGFPRLRIGIGPVPAGMDSVRFVLGDFDDSEQRILEKTLAKARDAMMMFAVGGVDAAMNAYNKIVSNFSI